MGDTDEEMSQTYPKMGKNGESIGLGSYGFLEFFAIFLEGLGFFGLGWSLSCHSEWRQDPVTYAFTGGGHGFLTLTVPGGGRISSDVLNLDDL